MKTIKHLIMLLILFSFSGCQSQQQETEKKLQDRQPSVAGQFYPKDSTRLKSMLKDLFSKAVPKKSENVLAIISPHAGYVYSGEVAATSFNQINNKKKYENIFILASSHHTAFEGASIYNIGNYTTPLGTAKVNIELANKIMKENKYITFYRNAHILEHSDEVQLPFLQYIMQTDFQIVPMVIATQNTEVLKQIASTLKPYFNQKNLFIISSDFSHYPEYKKAVEVDKATADAIVSNSPRKFQETLMLNESKKIPNLHTSACGESAIMVLLYITENNPLIQYSQIQYKNSGDAPDIGDKSRVVGYWSIVVSEKVKGSSDNPQSKDQGFNFTEKDKKDLLSVARKTIESYIKDGKVPEIDAKGFSENIKQHCGAFVTLHKKGALRGCIGQFTADEPLYKVVQDMAISASTKDYRFSAVTTKELAEIDIEISVLSPMKKISSIDEIELGRHGIYIKKGYNTGTYLPQVAKETGWTKEEFLGHCAQDKAGIGWDGWKDAEIYIYEAFVFGEKELGMK